MSTLPVRNGSSRPLPRTVVPGSGGGRAGHLAGVGVEAEVRRARRAERVGEVARPAADVDDQLAGERLVGGHVGRRILGDQGVEVGGSVCSTRKARNSSRLRRRVGRNGWVAGWVTVVGEGHPSPRRLPRRRCRRRRGRCGRLAFAQEPRELPLHLWGGGDGQHLVADLERPLRRRAARPDPRAGSRPARCPAAARPRRSGWPASGESSASVSSTSDAWPCMKRISRTRSPTRHRFLDECGEHPRGGDGDVDAPRLVEQPLVLRVVDAGDHALDAELGLGEQREDEVGLVVAGGRDHDVVVLQLGLSRAWRARRRRRAATSARSTVATFIARGPAR